MKHPSIPSDEELYTDIWRVVPDSSAARQLEREVKNALQEKYHEGELKGRIAERKVTELPFDGDHSKCLDKHSCIGYQNAASDLYNENLLRIAELESQLERKEQ